MNCFGYYTVQTCKRLSLPAEKLSFLYIQWCAYMDAICKEGLCNKTVSSHRNFGLYSGKIFKGNILRVRKSKKKDMIPHEQKQHSSFPLELKFVLDNDSC